MRIILIELLYFITTSTIAQEKKIRPFDLEADHLGGYFRA